MSDAVLIAVIVSLPPTITAIAGLLYVRGLHKKINSRMDQLIAQAEQIARAAGVKEGQAKRESQDRTPQ